MTWVTTRARKKGPDSEAIQERRKIRRVELGARLRRVRELEGWTQEQVALVLGYSRSHIHRVEQGLTELGVADLEVLAERFGMSLSALINSPLDDPYFR